MPPLIGITPARATLPDEELLVGRSSLSPIVPVQEHCRQYRAGVNTVVMPTVESPSEIRIPLFASVAGVLTAVLAMAILLSQVTVSADGDPGSLACGSAFDGVVDRTGWQEWWSADLEETNSQAPSALTRTRNCPNAVNSRIALSSALGAAALGTLALAGHARAQARTKNTTRSTFAAGLERAALFSSLAGTILTVGGAVGLIFLLADRDSTLFLYTDRLVVALIGVVVLVLPVTLIVFGQVLVAVSRTLGEPIAPTEPVTDGS